MRRLLIIALLLLLAQKHFDNMCQSYGFNKGAILTLEGVMCERSVQDSYTTAYLPLNGARLEWGWKNQPIQFQTDETQGMSLHPVD